MVLCFFYALQLMKKKLLVSTKKMRKRHKSIVDNVLHKNIDDGACHSENLIEPAIRNGELCEIGYPESVNVLL